MRCVLCECFSYQIFCKKCAKLLRANPSKRIISSREVISFYKYQNIKEILQSKHTPLGYRIYKQLAHLSFEPFINNLDFKAFSNPLYILGIDEFVQNGYAHIAILTHSLQNPHTIVLHAKLMAGNRVKYAGKTLKFRLDNPRNFDYTYKENISVVLVDDIITSGSTIKEAIATLKKYHVEVEFVLTLADARN